MQTIPHQRRVASDPAMPDETPIPNPGRSILGALLGVGLGGLAFLTAGIPVLPGVLLLAGAFRIRGAHAALREGGTYGPTSMRTQRLRRVVADAAALLGVAEPEVRATGGRAAVRSRGIGRAREISASARAIDALTDEQLTAVVVQHMAAHTQPTAVALAPLRCAVAVLSTIAAMTLLHGIGPGFGAVIEPAMLWMAAATSVQACLSNRQASAQRVADALACSTLRRPAALGEALIAMEQLRRVDTHQAQIDYARPRLTLGDRLFAAAHALVSGETSVIARVRAIGAAQARVPLPAAGATTPDSASLDIEPIGPDPTVVRLLREPLSPRIYMQRIVAGCRAAAVAGIADLAGRPVAPATPSREVEI